MSVETLEAFYEAVFAHPGAWTEDEYFALPEIPARVELVDGALVVNPLPDSVHQRLVREISYLLDRTSPTREWEVFPGLLTRAGSRGGPATPAG